MSIDEIISDFAFLDEWEDRYRYVIELGRALPALSATEKTEANKVRGCASQVWLVSETCTPNDDGDAPVLVFRGESDAHIVQGLVAILLAIYSGKNSREILSIDSDSVFAQLGLKDHLTPQRSNGVKSMVERIRQVALNA